MRRSAYQHQRRRLITAGVGLAAVAAMPLPVCVHAQMIRTPLNNMPEAIKRLTGAAIINTGRVKLDVPPLVENGHLVPLTVNVESPMTEANYVKAIHVYTERNPLPEMAVFRFTPLSGRAFAATRVRMADTQNVIAIAQMSDGSFWSDSVHLIVTLAACLEELPA